MPAEFEVEVDPKEVQELLGKALDAVKIGIRLTATDLWGNVREESPVDEGRLSGSWQLEGDDLEYRIFTNVLYALYVQEGTGIFGPTGSPIVPVNASVLAFEMGGEMIFAKSVRGMEANPYVDRAQERTQSRIDEFAELALQEAGV